MTDLKMPEDQEEVSTDSKMEEDHEEASQALKPRQLPTREITHSSAEKEDYNVLHELAYVAKRNKFLNHLARSRQTIESIVARHLGLNSAKSCRLATKGWIIGGFNACIRVNVHGKDQEVAQQVMIRFPLPYCVGEEPCPGNSDEKIRSEAGTYTWIHANCPEIPIPRLYGFGLSSGKTFTLLSNMPWYTRAIQYVRRTMLGWLGYPVPSAYIPYTIDAAKSLGAGYILIEYIKPSQGEMLSKTWDDKRDDPKLRKNLFHGLSRIMLSLTKTPLPKIGSWTIDENGYLHLANRPLTLQPQFLENEHIPIDMPRDRTYTRMDSYIHDLLATHESRLRHQPNAVRHLQDGFYQICALTLMRSVWPCFFRRDLLSGPFFLHLTDITQQNLFVDEEWNITAVLDLEWTCSLPVEMIHPPFWLSDQSISTIDKEIYGELHREFTEILKEEEEKATAAGRQPPIQLHSMLREGWERGAFWCTLAINTPMSLFDLFYDHMQPRFSEKHKDEEDFWLITMPYYGFGTRAFLDEKIKDKEEYDRNLREAFLRGDEYEDEDEDEDEDGTSSST